ncbi:MAG TPA: phosphate regulon sensor histidine kinase PhoR [Gammaproteobacteria bacterium]
MTSSLRREIELLLAWIVLLLILGSLLDQLQLVLLLGMFVYIFWTLFNLNRLTRWLSKPSKHTPDTFGVWDEVYYQLYHLYRRQRNARRRLASILNRFKTSTQALPYATIVLNEINEIEWFNPAAQQLFDFHSSLDVGQRIDNLIRQPEFVRYLAKRSFEQPLEFEYDQLSVLVNITPYGTGQYLLSARDVTQQHQLDEMRRDFISNASHELRTPLTVISGYVESLIDTVEDQALAMPLNKIQQQTQRMENIVAELIDLAKLESSSMVEDPVLIDARSLLEDVHNEALELSAGRHTITLNYTQVTISGNYAELRMAISNLLTNAIRYTADGGTIELCSRQAFNACCLCVKDNGPGIDYEHIPRLTERFYRVDEGRSREQGGTGLGLAIVKQVLDRHGGHLRIDSKVGRGSEFCCCFPHLH